MAETNKSRELGSDIDPETGNFVTQENAPGHREDVDPSRLGSALETSAQDRIRELEDMYHNTHIRGLVATGPDYGHTTPEEAWRTVVMSESGGHSERIRGVFEYIENELNPNIPASAARIWKGKGIQNGIWLREKFVQQLEQTVIKQDPALRFRPWTVEKTDSDERTKEKQAMVQSFTKFFEEIKTIDQQLSTTTYREDKINLTAKRDQKVHEFENQLKNCEQSELTLAMEEWLRDRLDMDQKKREEQKVRPSISNELKYHRRLYEAIPSKDWQNYWIQARDWYLEQYDSLEKRTVGETVPKEQS